MRSKNSRSHTAAESAHIAAINGVIEHILPQLDRPTADKLLDMIVEGWVK